MGLTHTGTQLWTTGGRRRCVSSKNSQTTLATTSTTAVRQLLGTANAQTAPAATRTAPAHQPLGSANVETTPAGALAAMADKTQQPDAGYDSDRFVLVGVGGMGGGSEAPEMTITKLLCPSNQKG